MCISQDMSEIKCTYPMKIIWRKSNYIEDPKIANKMRTHSKHLHKGERQTRRSEKRVLNKNGEAPQCLYTIEECTNMESLLPHNHLEHTKSARVQKLKKTYHLHQRYGWAIRRYQFLKIQHKIGPTERKRRSLKEYVYKLRDANWKLKPIENAKI